MSAHIPTQLLTCRCGSYTLGFDVQDVQEVLAKQHMTRVPRAPQVVCGLLNLRGDVVPALYLHHVLGIANSAVSLDSHRNLILTVGSSTLSLIVDEVGEVIELVSQNYFSEKGGLEAPFKELVQGIYQTPEITVLHLNPETSCRISIGVRNA